MRLGENNHKRPQGSHKIHYIKNFELNLNSFLKQRKKFAFEVLKFYQTDTAIHSLSAFEEKNCRNAAYSAKDDSPNPALCQTL